MGYSTYLDLIPIIERPRSSPTIAQEQPYLAVPGGIEGTISEDGRADSSSLFPELVDQSNPGERPDAFNTPSASDFLSWHTAWQIKYIKANNSSSLNVTIGSGSNKITAFLGDGTQSERVFIVQNLQKSDIGMMTKGTQTRLASLSDWTVTNGPADRFGFSKGGSIDSQRQALINILQNEYKAKMTKPSGSVMTDADVKLFSKQIDNIVVRLNNSALFNQAAIKDAADTILKRYKRAAAFSVPTRVNTDGTPIQGSDIDDNDSSLLVVGTLKRYPDPVIVPKTISTDGNQFINKGYTKFITEEKKILQADNAKIKLGSLVAAQPKSVDLPRLIFFMQLNYDLQKDRQSVANTEELKQQNRYVQDIGIFQRLINKTIGTFGTGTNETKGLLNQVTSFSSAYGNREFTRDDILAISMFELNSTDLSYLAHPIETLRGLPKRPTLKLGNPANGATSGLPGYWVLLANAFPRTTWENYATMASDYVNLINMESTMKQNENQSLDREKNNHYQLATGCISKMFDMLQAIARS